MNEFVACGVIRRWWHRRLRRIDRVEMLYAIKSRTLDSEKRRAMWQIFVEQPGQAHWRCWCGRSEAEAIDVSMRTSLQQAVYRARGGDAPTPLGGF